jgi:hypothetical protein
MLVSHLTKLCDLAAKDAIAYRRYRYFTKSRAEATPTYLEDGGT